MKWATLSKSVNEIYRLLPVNLTWYSRNNLLDVEDNLEDLDIYLPVTDQFMGAECSRTLRELTALWSSFLTTSFPAQFHFLELA
jgi:hypothetical protein